MLSEYKKLLRQMSVDYIFFLEKKATLLLLQYSRDRYAETQTLPQLIVSALKSPATDIHQLKAFPHFSSVCTSYANDIFSFSHHHFVIPSVFLQADNFAEQARRNHFLYPVTVFEISLTSL